MTVVTSISEALELFAPTFEPSTHDAALGWDEVLARAALNVDGSATSVGRSTRAGIRSRRWSPRRLAVVLVIVVAAVFATIAIAGSFGGFRSWLSGLPGRPASTEEQRAFDRGTRSWAGFPKGTSLRLLTREAVGGATYTLFGFRADGALCLRLVVSGNESVHQLACTPLSLLRSTTEPAIVVGADEGFGEAKPSPAGPTLTSLHQVSQAYVTYGIVADGIQRVEIANYNGRPTNAVLDGDAFLTVDDAPSVSEYLAHVWAIRSGRRVAIPFTLPGGVPSLGFAPTPPALTAHGPTAVQRAVHRGTIGWLTRREPVGTAVTKNIHHLFTPHGATVHYQREIAPDPRAPERMVVSLVSAPVGQQLCLNVVGGRYGGGSDCWPSDQPFSSGQNAFGSSDGVPTGIQVNGAYAPFSWIESQAGPVIPASKRSNQYDTIAGLASDTVATLRLYLGNGQTEPVPLHDNGYIVEAPTVDYPLRLVADDSRGRVIGIVTFSGPQTPPASVTQALAAHQQVAPNAHWRLLTANSAGYAFSAPGTHGNTCYAITTGASGSFNCQPPFAPTGLLSFEGGTGHEFTLTIYTGSAIRKITIHYQNGRTETIATPNGVALVRIPTSDQGTGVFARLRNIAEVTALNAQGQTVAVSSHGTITALTPTAITIRDTLGSAQPMITTCALTSSSPRQTGPGWPYGTGDRVQIICTNGQLTRIGLAGPPP